MSDASRRYNSPLRDGRAAETRRKVLESATRLLAQGASALTIPAVAREAGVAVPTVYRYFPSKEELEDGVAEHVRTLVGVMREGGPAGVDGLVERMREVWGKMSALPRAAQVVLLTSIGRELMAPPQTDRLARSAELLAPDLEGVQARDRDRYVKVTTALFSTPGAVGFRRLGIPDDEAVDLAEWMARTLYAGLQREDVEHD